MYKQKADTVTILLTYIKMAIVKLVIWNILIIMARQSFVLTDNYAKRSKEVCGCKLNSPQECYTFENKKRLQACSEYYQTSISNCDTYGCTALCELEQYSTCAYNGCVFRNFSTVCEMNCYNRYDRTYGDRKYEKLYDGNCDM